MHPPREHFIAAMSDAERAAFDARPTWLRQLLADGILIAAGPYLGSVNTGIAIFKAASEQRAHRSRPANQSPGAGTCAATCAPSAWACYADVTTAQ